MDIRKEGIQGVRDSDYYNESQPQTMEGWLMLIAMWKIVFPFVGRPDIQFWILLQNELYTPENCMLKT